MVYKNLQHDGGEDFLEETITRRKQTDELNKDIIEKRLEEADKQKLIDQTKWLSFDNPAIWDGEI